MRNYIVSIKNLYGEMETVYSGSNRQEAKQKYRKLTGVPPGQEQYLEAYLFTNHESRRVSKKGFLVREKIEEPKKKRRKKVSEE